MFRVILKRESDYLLQIISLLFFVTEKWWLLCHNYRMFNGIFTNCVFSWECITCILVRQYRPYVQRRRAPSNCCTCRHNPEDSVMHYHCYKWRIVSEILMQVTDKEHFITEESYTTTTKKERFKFVSGKKRINNSQLSNIYSSSLISIS